MLEKATIFNNAVKPPWLDSFANIHLEAEVISFYSWYQNDSINLQTGVHWSTFINIPQNFWVAWLSGDSAEHFSVKGQWRLSQRTVGGHAIAGSPL